MTVNVSGKLLVDYITDDGVEKRIEILSKDIDIEESETHNSDRKMGPEMVHVARAYNEYLGDIEWRIYEYPQGFVSHVEEPSLDGTIHEKPVFSIDSGNGAIE